MPPYKVKVSCLDCRFSRTGYAIAAIAKGDKHTIKTGHKLQIWRLGNPPRYLGTIGPDHDEIAL